jgi:hypothetical protein
VELDLMDVVSVVFHAIVVEEEEVVDLTEGNKWINELFYIVLTFILDQFEVNLVGFNDWY